MHICHVIQDKEKYKKIIIKAYRCINTFKPLHLKFQENNKKFDKTKIRDFKHQNVFSIFVILLLVFQEIYGMLWSTGALTSRKEVQ